MSTLLTNIISQKHSQDALCTYKTLFHKNCHSVHSVLTNIISQSIILNKNFVYQVILAVKLKYYGYTYGQLAEQMLDEAQPTPDIDIVSAALRLFLNISIAVLKTKYQTATTKTRSKRFGKLTGIIY